MGAVLVLVSPIERLFGIRGVAGTPVMLMTRSIHTFTLRDEISVVELDLDGIVRSVRRLPPRRAVRFSSLCWVVEYTSDDPLPEPGSRIVASVGRLLPSPGHVRNADPLRDTDRKSRRSL